ncbi:MAG: lipoprotein-releasing system transmembrane subunit LolC, partial [SAR324 cluster bacterium]|nr:lipoprotein-releasing system transmembrane subunit LolC [SAR324 cluster bacterium]
MRLELAICLRYLRSSRSDGAISFITWVALLGVVLGVAALVVAMAVMNGYQTNLVRVMASSL